MRRWGRFAVGAALVALLLAACGTDVVDAARLEQSIKEGIETSSGFTVTNVDCPQDRVFKLGDVFTCTAQISDGRTLIVTVTNESGGGNLKYQVTGVQ
ncbi:MAG: DUF4333 domain-containing protein [Candidatus Limnocylindrales bacterium]